MASAGNTSNGGRHGTTGGDKVTLIPIRVRVLGNQRSVAGSPVAAWVYHAQAAQVGDSRRAASREPDVVLWICSHEHRTPLAAQQCGVEWLAEHVSAPGDAAASDIAS